jgi:hypothetical protein
MPTRNPELPPMPLVRQDRLNNDERLTGTVKELLKNSFGAENFDLRG